jgi:iron-sulfur cluster repair protein YtfE (RIC family)
MGATADVSEAILAFAEHEHMHLARGIDRIHEAGCTVGTRPSVETLLQIREVLRWFGAVLEPHLAWEETWLFPRIDELTGTAWATRTARYDHGQMRELVARLRDEEQDATFDLTPSAVASLRCRLFALEALVRAHIEREERLLQPVLLDGGRGSGGADHRKTDA